MKQARSRFRKRTANILILTVFLLVVMLAFVALSVDVGYIYTVKARLQNAADAAACAGVIALTQDEQLAIPEAKLYAERNRAYPDEFTISEGDVQLGVWDDETASFIALSEDFQASPNAVRVSCHRTAARGNQVGLFFARILGNDYADVVGTATARYSTTKCGIVVGLSRVVLGGTVRVDSYKSSDGPYLPGTAGANGHVCSNGNITLNLAADIQGDAHPGGARPRVIDRSSGGVSGSTAPLTEPLEYPPADMSEAAAHNDNAFIPLSDDGHNPVNENGEFILGDADHVDLSAGTYYFTSMAISGTATVNCTAETIIFVDGDVSLTGGGILNDTTIPKNLQILSSGSNFNMSGTAAFYGVVYAPAARLTKSGSADVCGALITHEITASGDGGIHADSSLRLKLLEVGLKRTALVD